VLRIFAVAALTLCLAGCFGGGAGEEEDGTLDPSVLSQAADRATFHVRMPVRLDEYKLLNVGRVSGPDGHYAVDFDLVTAGGPILTVEQAVDAGVGVIRAWTKGARLLGSERIGPALWRVYNQPSAGGLVYARTYRDGVGVVLAGGMDRGPLRSLARSLGPPFS